MTKPTQAQRDLMRIAQEYCDEMDKSTEFMIQFMQDESGCDFDEVMEFLQEQMD